MIYACESCGHIFYLTQRPDQCSKCGENTVVLANAPKQSTQAEDRKSAKESVAFDVSAIKTKMGSCFEFNIHVSELGIDSEKVMTIMVKYEEEFLNNHYILNGDVWAKQPGDTVCIYMTSLSLTTDNRILPEEQINCLLDTLFNSFIFREFRKNLEKSIFK